MDLDTTIVAVSSPVGRSARSLIRASGPSAVNAAELLGLLPVPHKMCRGRLKLGTNELPIMFSVFPAGSSYTGQDIVEILLPNNRFLVDEVLRQLIVAANGRFAEAGEFTARAFLGGRISLTAAEGVCATISANNDAELQAATLLRNGELAKIVETVSTKIASTLAKVEAEIDFAEEEDVEIIKLKEVQFRVEECIKTMQSILNGKISMKTLQHLPRVVLAGAPNAGKSTLFNALLGKRRVVVSSAAGTTRDAISEPVLFNDKEALLSDIAGIEEITDQLSASSQQTAKNTIQSSDITLWCIEPKGALPPIDSAVVVHTKSDLPNAHPEAICATSGEGIEELRTRISKLLTTVPTPREGALALLPRHEQYLRDSISCLEESLVNLNSQELLATSLRFALDATGTISGSVTSDEILGKIFSSFCIGK
ncbi:MAG: GTPase [Planctomycetota bacterium]|nr:GTPase [Planctomycetota bacterium]